MERGVFPLINPEYVKNVIIKHEEKYLPIHIQNMIKKSRRRQIEKRGIKRVIEGEQFVRIKYIRYVNDFIVGVRGSLELAKEVKTMIVSFIKRSLHLILNDEKIKIINTYSDRVTFLGMLIYNTLTRDFSYKKARAEEGIKRVARKNRILKANVTNKVLKNIRHKLILALNNDKYKEVILELGQIVVRKVKNVRAVFRAMERVILGGYELKQISDGSQKFTFYESAIIKSIHATLQKYGAILIDLIKVHGRFPMSILKIISGTELRYCPPIIALKKEDKDQLILERPNNKVKKMDAVKNYIIVIRRLIDEQKKYVTGAKEIGVTLMNPKINENIIQNFETGIHPAGGPLIMIDREEVYERLQFAKIMNRKRNPCCKNNIVAASDYNIVVYFNRVAYWLLNYFRCADDFFRLKSIVNWFIRYSAISTIKFKHKLSSRKIVIEKYGKELTFTNHKGKIVSLISTDTVMATRKDFLTNSMVG